MYPVTAIENVLEVLAIQGLEDGKVLVLLVGEGDDEDDVGVLVEAVGQSRRQERDADAGAKLLQDPDLVIDGILVMSVQKGCLYITITLSTEQLLRSFVAHSSLLLIR